MRVALAGNPNVGKTSLFNRMTKSSEHVGNWHGVTVESKEKMVLYNEMKLTIFDLPGIYSLTVFSPEERVSRDVLLFEKNDLVVCVCEVNNLSRNLYLALQLLELNTPIVLAINMVDELKRSHRVLNTELLSKRLGIDVVAISAKKSDGGNKVLECVSAFFEKKDFKKESRPRESLPYFDKLEIGKIASMLDVEAKRAGLRPEFAAIKLLDGDVDILKMLKLDSQKSAKIKAFFGQEDKAASARYSYIDELLKDVIVIDEGHAKSGLDDSYINGKSKIDRFALNKAFALPLFFVVMFAVFFLTFSVFGRFFSGLIDLAISKLWYNPLEILFERLGTVEWLSALVLDGVVSGIGGIITFLPQVVLLFFFLALLEDSGYISRVAFMTDGLFEKVGLSGRSGFSMLMGFGCSATAIMTTRTLEDEKVRKKTILLTPFMSCSARLPVFSVIAAAFFGKGSTFVIFGMYMLGIFVAFLVAVFLQKSSKSLRSGGQSFIMELPPYRLPSFERVFQLIKGNVWDFVVRVGTVIFALNTILWVLSNFSIMHGYTVGTEYKSIFESIGSVIAPIFSPLGFGNWKAATSLLGGVAAKEVVITLIESLGGVESVFVGRFAAQSAFSFMVFTLLYVPCTASLTAIKRETGTRWMLFCLFVQFVVAYVFSLVFYWGSVLISL